jgi:hypothetical protein
MWVRVRVRVRVRMRVRVRLCRPQRRLRLLSRCTAAHAIEYAQNFITRVGDVRLQLLARPQHRRHLVLAQRQVPAQTESQNSR